MIKLIIFDLDGVLVHASWEGIYEAYKAVIGFKGKDWRTFFRNFEEFQKWWTPNYIDNERRIDLKPEEMKEAHKVFYQTVSPYFYLMGWTHFVLPYLLSKKYKLAILTNRNRKTAIEHLKPILGYFDIVITADELQGKLKPDPFGINFILGKTGFSPSEAVMVGDRPEDLMAGIFAGTKTAAVIWEHGLSCDGDFEILKPDFVLTCVDDFCEFLEKR